MNLNNSRSSSNKNNTHSIIYVFISFVKHRNSKVEMREPWQTTKLTTNCSENTSSPSFPLRYFLEKFKENWNVFHWIYIIDFLRKTIRLHIIDVLRFFNVFICISQYHKCYILTLFECISKPHYAFHNYFTQ